MDAMQKKMLHDTVLSFLRIDGKPDSMHQSHIREAYLRYLKYCDAMDELHLPEIWFKRVVRREFFPELEPKNLPPSPPESIWDFVSKLEE